MKHALLSLAAVALVSGCAGFAVGADPSSQKATEKQARQDKIDADKQAGKASQHIQPGDVGPPTDNAADLTGQSGFTTTAAGDGQIVESGAAGPPGDTENVWRNQWYVTLADGRVVVVYAGAQKANSKQGVVLVTIWDAGQVHLLKSVLLATPRAAGVVRFVGGAGKVATLQAADGSDFTFDAGTLTVR